MLETFNNGYIVTRNEYAAKANSGEKPRETRRRSIEKDMIEVGIPPFSSSTGCLPLKWSALWNICCLFFKILHVSKTTSKFVYAVNKNRRKPAVWSNNDKYNACLYRRCKQFQSKVIVATTSMQRLLAGTCTASCWMCKGFVMLTREYEQSACEDEWEGRRGKRRWERV